MPTLIDPEQIYPKRIGRHREGLVIEYYNLDKDSIKRHLIPYDDTESVEKTIENILKNPKHSVFLRKVAPHHIKAVISGQKFDILPQNINEKSKENSHSYQNSSDNDYSKFKTESQRNTSSVPSSQYSGDYSSNPTSKSSYEPSNEWKKKKDLDESGSYNLSTSKISNGKLIDKAKGFVNLEDSHGYSMNFDEESMNISVVPNKDIELHEHVVEEEIEYEEDFEELSSDKKEIEEQLRKQKEEEDKKMEEERKKKEKQEKKKKEKEIKENDMDFDFLDDEEPKKKKKKKDKSKSKEKDTKKEVKKEETPIEDDFDFI